jgi:hypothetical protein
MKEPRARIDDATIARRKLAWLCPRLFMIKTMKGPVQRQF